MAHTIKIYSHHGQSLNILSTSLSTSVLDLTATHTLTQLYYNPSKSASEEDYFYTFPLYESSAVHSFKANINNERVFLGIVKPKSTAKKIYDTAKAEGRFATLLESNTADVFTTTLGNIPPEAVVKVEISYVHELTQDTGSENVKLVVPTIITARYGAFPEGLSRTEIVRQRCQWAYEANKSVEEITEEVALEVDIAMSGNIQEIQSPSHPLSVTLGRHSFHESSSSFDPKLASAKIGNGGTSLKSLDEDFVLMIRAEGTDRPRGFIAPHPTDPRRSVMLLTLVPKFVLPQQLPEVVFIIDRSGSMAGKIGTVKTALNLFLASLPIGVHFNICSFGSHHTFMFPLSKAYNEHTLAEAKAYVSVMEANFGGTEMFPPLEDTISRRLKDLNLEILFVTDGDVWNGQPLLDLLSGAAKEGVRLFSLGIGSSISHSLVESIARVGRGYAQTVKLQERLERKVVRMLKSALSPHIYDWNVGWEGKAEIETQFSHTISEYKKSADARMDDVPALNEPVSLYDEKADTDNPPPAAEEEDFPGLPRAPIIQAPSMIPPLYPFSRTTVYFMLPTPPPKEVTLSGSFQNTADNSITPLELSIPLTPVPSSMTHLHTLFGRKYLQDLSEGGLPAHFKTIVDPELSNSKYHKLVEREGTNAGLEYSLAGRWTSFVAIDESKAGGKSLVDLEVRIQPIPATTSGVRAASGRRLDVSQILMGVGGRKQIGYKAARKIAPRPDYVLRGAPSRDNGQKPIYFGGEDDSTVDYKTLQPAQKRSRTHHWGPEEILDMISKQQGFDGTFLLTDELLEALGVHRDKLTGLYEDGQEWVLATVLVLIFLDMDKRMTDLKEEFELIQAKASGAVAAVDVAEVEKGVRKLLETK